MSLRKIVLIGIDGCSWRLIEPWIEEGFLPTLRQIKYGGTYGTLQSTIPPNTHPAWTSIFTGTNPGKHGITDFIIRTDNSKFIVADSSKRMVDSIWRILSRFNLKSVVVNDPVTFPPEPINGIMTTGLLTPPSSRNFVYPLKLRYDLDRATEGYEFELPIDFVSIVKEDKKKAIECVDMFAKKIGKATLYLASNYDWDILATIQTSTDRLQHFFWEEEDILLDHYSKLDRLIKEILTIKRDVNVFIVSDHGFGPMKKYFYINRWLFSEGFLKLKRSNIVNWASSIGLTYSVVVKFLLRLRLYHFLRKIAPNYIKERIPISEDEKEIVDYTQSLAYSIGYQGIYLNDNSVSNVDRIIHSLLEIEDNRRPIISTAFKGDKVCWGPYRHRGADISISPCEGFELSPLLHPFVLDVAQEEGATRTGTHRPEGVFMAYGPDIKKGHKLNSIQTWDVTPTLLHFFGLPVSSHMDGRVLKEIFSNNSKAARRKVRFTLASERERILERVRSLNLK